MTLIGCWALYGVVVGVLTMVYILITLGEEEKGDGDGT